MLGYLTALYWFQTVATEGSKAKDYPRRAKVKSVEVAGGPHPRLLKPVFEFPASHKTGTCDTAGWIQNWTIYLATGNKLSSVTTEGGLPVGGLVHLCGDGCKPFRVLEQTRRIGKR